MCITLFKVYTSQPAVVFLFSPPQILPLRQIRKTRAGRITPLELWPLALVECVEEPAVPASGLDRIWQGGEEALRRMAEEPPPIEAARRWRSYAGAAIARQSPAAAQPYLCAFILNRKRAAVRCSGSVRHR